MPFGWTPHRSKSVNIAWLRWWFGVVSGKSDNSLGQPRAMTTAAPLISMLEIVCLVVLLNPVAGLPEYPTSTALVLYVATICTLRYMRDLQCYGQYVVSHTSNGQPAAILVSSRGFFKHDKSGS
ncbi:uncharacterized protein B0J16DRAFT_346993 [Fusarium flagelliforme]|uniref:uncharacterized protein n=1 Tax=Fusarium flagelliforme TaxID=2675880 RepID=UPI001E8D073D|nr:uncharacterized protein B0J16DRAFT_346993 [Fusarium flagelliforme]KAH7179467.1 hypothetical protein B0J16DRAFT_346993 [Fusarium flagelliforme]